MPTSTQPCCTLHNSLTLFACLDALFHSLSLLQVLEAYCNWLENRVVARFDAAVAEGNLKLQAQSVSIMIELDKERSIAQVNIHTSIADCMNLHSLRT
jgi:hypothetical protein